MSLDFTSLFGDAILDCDCPKCNSSISFKFSDVGSIITCPNCKEEIQLNPADDFYENIDSASDALAEFEDVLNNFGK